jgi:hypothetical protein
MAEAPDWLSKYFSVPSILRNAVIAPLRSVLEFAGAPVTITDDPVNKRTVVTIGNVPTENSSGEPLTTELTTTDATPATAGATFDLPVDSVIVVDVEVECIAAGAPRSKLFVIRRVFHNDAGTFSEPAQVNLLGPTEYGSGSALTSAAVSITRTGSVGRIDVTGIAAKTIRWRVDRQVTRLTAPAAAPGGFDPTTIADLTMWLDATDLTQGSGIVTAINNKAPGGSDPTITATEEPSYLATNPNYNGRPTWKCDAGLGTAKVIRATAGQHGLTTGPYTVVIVGQCKDSNYAMGAPSGGTLIAGGGGSGNKWQVSSDAATYLPSTAGVADNPSVAIFVVDGASSKAYVNSLTPTTGPAGTIEDLSASNLYIGNYGGPADALGQDGDTTHFLLFDAALSQADCEYLLNGFGAEAGITINP